MADRITLTSGALTATIDPLGAELVSLRDGDGRGLMTDADPAFWSGHAPILFPVVGRLDGDVLRVDGRDYPMKQHGFARRATFACRAQTATQTVFELTDTAETRIVYPFQFRLVITYTVAAATLTVDVGVENRGAVPLPASLGFHPAFAWPLPYGAAREAHRIVFDADEPLAIKRLEDGLIAGDRASPLAGRTLALTDALFEGDALIWFGPASQGVTYGADTGPRLRIDFPDTPFLGIWSQPGAHFVCIEPWHGHADPAGFTGEFRDKPGVFEVAPGTTKWIAMRVTLEG